MRVSRAHFSAVAGRRFDSGAVVGWIAGRCGSFRHIGIGSVEDAGRVDAVANACR